MSIVDISILMFLATIVALKATFLNSNCLKPVKIKIRTIKDRRQ